jgi:exo-poly-alpha-galacturonosidase
VVFYRTTIETSNYPGFEGKSLIMPLGWQSTLGGESPFMYEFGSVEQSDENNQSSRATWSTVLSSPTLLDNTEITPFSFTKGNDGWDPIPELIAAESEVGIASVRPESSVQIYSSGNRLFISNVQSNSQVRIYNPNGSLINYFDTQADTTLNLSSGLWIVRINSIDGEKAVRVFSQ